MKEDAVATRAAPLRARVAVRTMSVRSCSRGGGPTDCSRAELFSRPERGQSNALTFPAVAAARVARGRVAPSRRERREAPS